MTGIASASRPGGRAGCTSCATRGRRRTQARPAAARVPGGRSCERRQALSTLGRRGAAHQGPGARAGDIPGADARAEREHQPEEGAHPAALLLSGQPHWPAAALPGSDHCHRGCGAGGQLPGCPASSPIRAAASAWEGAAGFRKAERSCAALTRARAADGARRRARRAEGRAGRAERLPRVLQQQGARPLPASVRARGAARCPWQPRSGASARAAPLPALPAATLRAPGSPADNAPRLDERPASPSKLHLVAARSRACNRAILDMRGGAGRGDRAAARAAQAAARGPQRGAQPVRRPGRRQRG